MTDEIENTEAEDQAIEDAAFAAAMAESVGDSNTPPAAVEEEKVEDPKDETTAQSTKEVAERVEVFNGMTADEITGSLSKVSTLQKALDTANGTHGSQLQQLNATIAELRTSEKKQETPEINGESLEIHEEFPELADKLAKDFVKFKQDPEDIKTLVNAAIKDQWTKQQQEDAQKEQDKSLSMLEKAHPDWNKVAGISDSNGMMKFNDLKFGNWVAAQPEDIQSQIINGRDVGFLTAQITEYKKTIKPTKTTKPDLNLALIPDGSTQNEQTFQSDDDETEAAFRATMKKLAQG